METCTICIEKICTRVKFELPCKHTFHRTCLARWIGTGSEICPNCRQNISESAKQACLLPMAVRPTPIPTPPQRTRRPLHRIPMERPFQEEELNDAWFQLHLRAELRTIQHCFKWLFRVYLLMSFLARETQGR